MNIMRSLLFLRLSTEVNKIKAHRFDALLILLLFYLLFCEDLIEANTLSFLSRKDIDYDVVSVD